MTATNNTYGSFKFIQKQDPDLGGATRDALVIDTSGRVGIGTTSPVYTLHNQGSIGIGTAGISGSYDLIWAPNTSGQQIKWIRNDQGALSIGAGLTAGTLEHLRIDNLGRLGLGTTNPQNLLHLRQSSGDAVLRIENDGINGSKTGIRFQNSTDFSNHSGGIYCIRNGGTDHDLLFQTYGSSAGNTRMVIKSNGNVGIGTTSPDDKLDIEGTGDIKAVIQTTSTGSTANAALRLKTGDYNWLLQTGDIVNGGIRFYSKTSNSERARIDSSGRLLVGTPSSATGTESQYAKLVVAGNTNNSTGAGILNIQKGSGAGATDYLGRVVYSDNDHDFAYIDSIADGSTTAGRLVFSTTADGASAPTERLRIASTGAVGLSGANYGSAGDVLTSQGSGAAPQWAPVSAQGPTFRATLFAGAFFTANTDTKVPYDTVIFDTDSCYDNTTNYRFTPTKAGYYLTTASCALSFGAGGHPNTLNHYITVYKNGGVYAWGNHSRYSTSTSEWFIGTQSCTTLVYMNGSTDYLEGYVRSSDVNPSTAANAGTFFESTWVHD
jgi:hypothetical protein